MQGGPHNCGEKKLNATVTHRIEIVINELDMLKYGTYLYLKVYSALIHNTTLNPHFMTNPR